MNKRITFSALACGLILTMLFGGFIFTSNGTAETATGTVFALADFDNTSFPPAGWTVSNTSSYDWIRTSYCSGYGVGTSCAVVDFYDYAGGNFDLITNTFTATTAGDSLVFDHAYATSVPASNDKMDIYTSIDGGSSYTLLISLAGGSSGPLVTGTATNDLFVPNATQWATKRYLLPVGTNKIKFEGVSAFGNNLYLDNVRFGSAYGNDVGVNSIRSPKWGITPQSVAPQVSVRNYGTTAQSFNVTMTINPGGYTNTQAVSNLAPGQIQVVDFTTNNFATAGNYTMKAYTSLGTDQNASNDTITNTLVVTPQPRNVVLELCTGTWCQWCPCGDKQAHNLSIAYPNAVILAYHGGSDPWRFYHGMGIIGMLGFAGYPSGLVDRRLGINNGWGSMFTDAEYRMAQSPAATVNISQTSLDYNSATRVLTVNLNATALTTLSGQYKVNFIITEDNLVYPQTGNAYCPQNSNAVHNWVVRNYVNDTNGVNVNTGTWNANQTYPLTFTTTLAAAWQSSNCKYDVIIFKDNGTINTSEIQQGTKGVIDLNGINSEGTVIPKDYKLSQNFPNPFNPTTNVHFSIPKDGNATFKVYNSLGQLVETYFDGMIKAGNYNAEIESANWASGIYFYTLATSEFTQTKKMILLK